MWRYGAYFLLSAFLILIAVGHYAAPIARFYFSSKEGVAWLMHYPDDYGNPGVFWVLNDIEKNHCKSFAFRSRIDERFGERPRDAVSRAYFQYPEPADVAGILEDDALPRYDRWLLSALYCKENPVAPHVRDTLVMQEMSTGYDLTHKYLALTYLERLGCASPSEQEAREEAAKRMAEDGREAAVTDLGIEQAAFLLWGGHGHLVPDAWLERIRLNQSPSGGWGGAYKEPVPHTTALAAWALTQRTGLCPL